MNTPTPVSALNTLTRPEKSASSKGSANDSGTSFSSALEQQKKTVSESEKPSGTARAPESGTEAPKENVAQRPDSQESKDESQQEIEGFKAGFNLVRDTLNDEESK